MSDDKILNLHERYKGGNTGQYTPDMAPIILHITWEMGESGYIIALIPKGKLPVVKQLGISYTMLQRFVTVAVGTHGYRIPRFASVYKAILWLLDHHCLGEMPVFRESTVENGHFVLASDEDIEKIEGRGIA